MINNRFGKVKIYDGPIPALEPWPVLVAGEFPENESGFMGLKGDVDGLINKPSINNEKFIYYLRRKNKFYFKKPNAVGKEKLMVQIEFGEYFDKMMALKRGEIVKLNFVYK